MAKKINCTIVSGAPGNDLSFIKQKINRESFIIAADSGYIKLLNIGIKPDLIVADFDSSKMPDICVDCEVFPVEKDATDTFNAVKIAVEKGYKKIVIMGALGGRLDHTYSNILCLDYAFKHGAECVIIDENNRVSLINNKKTFYKEYKWFSLFAFLENCYGVKIEGAHYTQDFYNLGSLDIMLSDQNGQSNYIENEKCTVSVKSGTLLLIESNDFQ